MQVLLVGGFAASPYLQDKVQGLQRSGLVDRVIVPPNPHAAVLSGKPAILPVLSRAS